MTAALPFTEAEREALLALRRDLHTHPELSWKERETQRRLETALGAAGVHDVRRIATTGLVARIPGRDPSAPVVALRGDIDALPIQEATGLPYASANAGVMHACGHDVHASWAVGAARLLARDPAAGEVRIVLQPAEEVGEGASAVLASGALDGVRAIFGGHVDRRFEVGQVVAQAGPLAASTDSFTIAVRGRGGHGARPQYAADPVVASAAVVQALQTLVSRRLEPGVPGVVTVGSIHGGLAANVIPDVVELAGTIRATTAVTRALLVDGLRQLAASVAAAHGVTADVAIAQGTPPLENTPDASSWAAQAVTRVLGAGGLAPLGTTNMGGEDFAFYLERIPGCFLRIGAREPGGAHRDVHTATFAPDEGALFVGAAVLAECARVASTALAATR